MRQIMNKKNSSPKQVSDKRDTGMNSNKQFFECFFLLMKMCSIFIHIISAGTVRHAQKRPATSPAPMLHSQPTANHTNVSISVNYMSIFNETKRI